MGEEKRVGISLGTTSRTFPATTNQQVQGGTLRSQEKHGFYFGLDPGEIQQNYDGLEDLWGVTDERPTRGKRGLR